MAIWGFAILLMMMMFGVAKGEVYRLILHHIDAGKSIPEKLALGSLRSEDRFKALAARTKKPDEAITKKPHDIYEFKLHTVPADYHMVLQLGTPPINFTTSIDTGSDVVWVHCNNEHRHCSSCSPMLIPSQSTSFSSISCKSNECHSLPSSSCPTNDIKYDNMYHNSCVYKYEYADHAYSIGEYAKDSLTLSSSLGLGRSFKINIGCAHTIGQGYQEGGFHNANGMVGFSREPASLISQLPFFDGKFSYCLTHYSKDAHSILFLGDNLPFSTDARHSTPILGTPNRFYSVRLQSITVGNTMISRCNSSLDLNAGGLVGKDATIFDSGSAFTSFSPPVFDAIIDAFIDALPDSVVSSVNNDDYVLGQYKACFDVSDTPNIKVPSLSFQFDGASFHPPSENYVHFEGSQMCLLILPSQYGFGIVGNIMQQNHLISYDAKGMKISFMKSDCSKL